ncbi:MAG: hypothetical protein M1118_00850 [Chloroflexi bacterium]|nr:hypothetical protein [Chloroflexota bacterium]
MASIRTMTKESTGRGPEPAELDRQLHLADRRQRLPCLGAVVARRAAVQAGTPERRHIHGDRSEGLLGQILVETEEAR